MLVARGTSSYYNMAPPSDTARLRELLDQFEAHDASFNLADADDGYWQRRAELDFELRRYELAAERIVDVLASIGLLVLRGELSAAGAYAVLGPAVIRNGGALRTLVTPPARNAHDPDFEVLWRVQGWSTYRPGVVRRLNILIDILWAEAVRFGDLAPYELIAAADAKAAGSGSANRARVKAEARLVGRWPLRWWTGARLSRRLRVAEWQRFGRGLDRRATEHAAEAWLQGGE
jgi:hypothetical protein